MIRSWEEAQEKLSKALETVSVCITFGIPLLLTQSLPDVAPLWKWVAPLIGLAVAVFLSTFVYGRPSYRLTWKVMNESADGVAVVDLKRAKTPLGVPEVTFDIHLRVATGSLWAAYLHRRRQRHGYVEVWIELRPPGSADIKDQCSPSSGSRVQVQVVTIGDVAIDQQTIVLPVTSASVSAGQSRFVGSMIPLTLVSKTEDVAVAASLRIVRGTRVKPREVSRRDIGVHTIRIRS